MGANGPRTAKYDPCVEYAPILTDTSEPGAFGQPPSPRFKTSLSESVNVLTADNNSSDSVIEDESSSSSVEEDMGIRNPAGLDSDSDDLEEEDKKQRNRVMKNFVTKNKHMNDAEVSFEADLQRDYLRFSTVAFNHKESI